MTTRNVIFTVEHHDETTDKVHAAGSSANVDRVHASNLVYRGLARYNDRPAAPAAGEPDATSADDSKKGRK
jgi:hypothetical protein